MTPESFAASPGGNPRDPRKPCVGSIYRIDGELWRVCCIDAEGADIHKLDTWKTRHLSPDEWETFQELNEEEQRAAD